MSSPRSSARRRSSRRSPPGRCWSSWRSATSRTAGVWQSEPTLWSRYDRPGRRYGARGAAELIGTIQVAYGSPTRYDITIYRVTVTKFGTDNGWTVVKLCDEALGYGSLDLAGCPRASLNAPPKPFRF